MHQHCFLNESYVRSDINDSSKLWIELKKELDDVKKILALYLCLITKNNKYREDMNVIKSIIKSGIHAINFNYTSTIQDLYNIPNDNIQYIHGQLPQNIFSMKAEENKTDIVLGMPDINDEDLDTVYFKKSFQRIQYQTGIEYMYWFTPDKIFEEFDVEQGAEVIFYGHSMDKNDGDLIKYIIENKYTKRTTIYYLDQVDYETKIINLIRILGKQKFEELYYNGKIKFNNTKQKYKQLNNLYIP